MDAVSASIGFVSTGFAVVQLARKTVRDVKTAPQQIRSLLDRVADIEYCLKELEIRQAQGVWMSASDLQTVERWNQRTVDLLERTDIFVKKVSKAGARNLKDVKVDIWQWLTKRSTIDDATRDLNELQSTLSCIMQFINS